MKTAMQELIDEMTKYLDLHESPEVKEVLRILKASAIRKYWKKEKEQIIETWKNGAENGVYIYRMDEPYFGNAEEYYNQTYNK
jgi:hypothetical protein